MHPAAVPNLGISRVAFAVLAALTLAGAVASAPRSAHAQALTAPGGVLWTANYANGGYDIGYDIAENPSHTTVFMAGSSDGSNTGTDYVTAAYSATTGAKQWASRYNGYGSGDDVALADAVTPDGSKVFTTGRSDGRGTATDAVTVAYDAASGAKLWAARFDDPSHSYDKGLDVVVSPNSKRLFVGIDIATGSYEVVAYNAATGGKLWAATYNAGGGATDDHLKAIAISPDGTKVVVTGQATSSSTVSEWATVAFNANTGAQLWAAEHNEAGFADVPAAVTISSDGTKAVVTGTDQTTSNVVGTDYQTIAYSLTTGGQQWATHYDGPAGSADSANAIVASSSAVFVTGTSTGTSTGADITTVAYNPSTGAQLWVNRYSGPGTGSDAGYAIALNPAGTTVFAAGLIHGTTTQGDYGVVAMSASNGSRLWVGRRGGANSQNDYANSVVADNSAAYATGFMVGQSNVDAVTIAFAEAT